MPDASMARRMIAPLPDDWRLQQRIRQRRILTVYFCTDRVSTLAWRIKRWAAGAPSTVAKMIAAALTFEIKELRAEREKQRKPAPDAQRRRARFEVVPRSNERERDD